MLNILKAGDTVRVSSKIIYTAEVIEVLDPELERSLVSLVSLEPSAKVLAIL